MPVKMGGEPPPGPHFKTPKSEVDTLIGQMAEIASEVSERLGCCHGPTEARGRYADWARKYIHRESLRELSRCRHAALDRILLLPTDISVPAV